MVVHVRFEHGQRLLTDQPAIDARLGKTRCRRDHPFVDHVIHVVDNVFC